MIARSRSSSPSRAGRSTAALVTVGGLVLLIAAGLVATWYGMRPEAVHLVVNAVDSTGAPVAAPIRIDAKSMGTTPVTLEGWWRIDPERLASGEFEAEYVPSGVLREGPAAREGTRPVVEATSAVLADDGVLFATVRASIADGRDHDHVFIDVGPEGGPKLEPVEVFVGRGTGGRRGWTVEFTFRQP